MRGARAGPERILKEARSWIGTPYRHQMSLKGTGCDCIGLVRGIWLEIYGQAPCGLPAYSPDWAEVGGREDLLDGLARLMTQVALAEARPGDVLVFRMMPGAVAKHAAVLSLGDMDDPRARIIHAYWGRAVVESWLRPFWTSKAAAAFRFPIQLDRRKSV